MAEECAHPEGSMNYLWLKGCGSRALKGVGFANQAHTSQRGTVTHDIGFG